MNPKPKKVLLLSAALLIFFSIAFAMNLISFSKKPVTVQHVSCAPEHEACVMKTIFGLEERPLAVAGISSFELPAEAQAAINSGLTWIAKAQDASGGWGAGYHSMQQVRDPHAVPADPA